MLLSLLVLLVHLILSQHPSLSANTEENLTDQSFKENDMKYFNDIISSFMRERQIPGASVAISKHGKLIFKRGYGRAGMYRWVTPWSLFRIGSVSKPVTAVGVLKAMEMNKLSLDQLVFGPHGILSEYVPTERGDRRLLDIKVIHLLQHTAGWDQNIAGDPLMWRGVANAMGIPEPPDHHTLLIYMMSQPLQFSPGERYAYSSFGYMILGRIIEQVTGMPYDVFIRKQLSKVGIYSMKLGHTRKTDCDKTEVEYFADYPSSRVMSVFPRDGLVPPPYGGFCMENMDSAGGWIASSEDLVRFFDSLNSSHHGLLKGSTFAQMLQQPAYVSQGSWYGLGVVVQDGGSTWWHSGVLDGSTSILTHDSTGFTWAVLLNLRLQHNDLDDLIKFAIHSMPSWYGRLPVPLPPLAESVVSKDGKNLVKLMIPEHHFPHVRNLIISQGFRLSWIDAYSDNKDQVFFNTVWVRDEHTVWKVYHSLSSSAYRRRQHAKTIQGYRLVHVEAYISEGRLRYAAIFIKQPWPAWVAYHGYSPHKHRDTFHQMLRDGYRLVIQSVVEFKNKLYVAALYDRLNMGKFRVRMGLTPKQFSGELEEQTAQGHVLSYIQTYSHHGLTKVSAIWGAPRTPQWAILQDATKYVLFNKLYECAKLSLPLACVTAYDDQGVTTFTALWL